ncbi:MAG: hypothetical protein U9N61_09500 [Euryarchaeota archaeon]|nr:hypothetical protein [Euryarchaeota archaeon]
MRLLLILTIFFSLTQLASAERWRGLIASVAALESAKIEAREVTIETPKVETEPVTKAPVPVTKAPVPDPEPITDKVKVCDESGCRLVPIFSAGEATETTVDGKKSVSPLASSTSTTKYYTTRRFRLFERRCSSCR